MGKKHPAVEEARDLRNAMDAIGRVLGDGSITPKGRLQQVAGILGMMGVRAAVAPSVKLFKLADWVPEADPDQAESLFGAVPAGTGE